MFFRVFCGFWCFLLKGMFLGVVFVDVWMVVWCFVGYWMVVHYVLVCL